MNQYLNQYYVFFITAKCGNISNAAKKLYISQPAVSKAIARLEEGLDTELFYRSSRGVSLTEAGEILYRQLETAFGAIEAGEEQIRRNEALGCGKLSIGASTTLCKYVLLPFLQPYLEKNPHVTISISCQSTYDTIAALEAGSLDIGLIGETDHIGNLIFRPVRTISDIFVASRSYIEHLLPMEPRQRERLLSGRDVEDAPPLSAFLSQATLLTLDKNNVSRQYIDKYLLLHDIRTGRQLEVTTMDLLIDFARIGLGAACVIREFVEKELKEGSLVKLPTREPIPPRRIGFAYSRHVPVTSAIQRFLEQLDASTL